MDHAGERQGASTAQLICSLSPPERPGGPSSDPRHRVMNGEAKRALSTLGSLEKWACFLFARYAPIALHVSEDVVVHGAEVDGHGRLGRLVGLGKGRHPLAGVEGLDITGVWPLQHAERRFYRGMIVTARGGPPLAERDRKPGHIEPPYGQGRS